MGVRELKSFLRANKLFERVEISNTDLVIDSTSLMYQLFDFLCDRQNRELYKCDNYAGDMVAYGKWVREFFALLNWCKIRPIVVVDGSKVNREPAGNDSLSAIEELKIKERYESSMEAFRTGKFISPPILYEVYGQVIISLGVEKVQCPDDAHIKIAELAWKLNCPILTNNSDFIMFDLPKGHFNLARNFLLDFQLKPVRPRSFLCLGNSRNLLMKNVPGLDARNISLLVVLEPNNYYRSRKFPEGLEVEFVPAPDNRFVMETPRQRNIGGLLDLLRGKTFEEALEAIILKADVEDPVAARDSIEQLLHKRTSTISLNLKDEICKIYPDSGAEAGTPPDQMPSTYLERMFKERCLSHWALDIIFRATAYSHAVLGDDRADSPSLVSHRPISVALAILRPKCVDRLRSDMDAIQVYDRIDTRYDRIKIKPLDHLENYGSLENLNIYTAIKLDQALKRSIVMATFRFTSGEYDQMSASMSSLYSGSLVHESTICFLLVRFAALETELDLVTQFVDALLLVFFNYAALSNKSLNADSHDEAAAVHLLRKLRPTYIACNRTSTLYRRIVHHISILQHAYSSFILINSLLDEPLDQLKPDSFMNGPLIYQLMRDLHSRVLNSEFLFSKIPALEAARVMVRLTLDEGKLAHSARSCGQNS